MEKSKLNKSHLTSLLLGLGFLGLLGLGYWLGPRLAPARDLTLPVPACDLNQGPCRVALPGGGHLVAEISPWPIPVLKPLSVKVSLEGYEASAVLLDFSGVEMDMGFNQVSLEAGPLGQFSGRGNLPVCVTGRMRWQASFILQGPGGRLAVPFHFDSGS